eukprot:COSAG06_NODE_1536_length_9152_cov_19.634044_7_plen_44_part_00
MPLVDSQMRIIVIIGLVKYVVRSYIMIDYRKEEALSSVCLLSR